MQNRYIKNVAFESALPLSDLVSYQPGQIASKTLAQNPAVSLTVFAFEAGEEISTHASSGDAMVYVIDGQADVTIDGTRHRVGTGQYIVMPAGVPHAVEAPERFKMLLTVVFPPA